MSVCKIVNAPDVITSKVKIAKRSFFLIYTLFENNYDAINYLTVVHELKDNSMSILFEFHVLFGPVRGIWHRI